MEFIPAGKRVQDTRNDGLTREQLREALLSPNPLRENISYTEEQLFFAEITQKYGLNSGHVRIFNETMEGMTEFYQRAIKNGKITSKNVDGKVIIQVKYLEASSATYYDKSPFPPHVFLKNRGISQELVFRQVVSEKEITDIITVPFMYGSKWCFTANMTPSQLHQAGENALSYRGFFILDGTPRFTVAHEKIAHNAITTVFSDEKRSYLTSLKIQDERNNSVEYLLYKGVKSRSSAKREEENTYFITSGCFNQAFEVNKIFKQIYILLQRIRALDETLEPLADYDQYIRSIIRIVAGDRLQHYVLYDWTEESLNPITPPKGAGTLSEAMDVVYREFRKNTYQQLNPSLTAIGEFAEMVISSFFPSVNPSSLIQSQNVFQASLPTESSILKAKYDSLHSKAMLLMRMVVANLLTEQGVLPPTNRNNVGNKAYLSAAEIFRRDLTKDEGSLLRKKTPGGKSVAITDYRPKSSVARGEANVLEVLDFSNLYEVFSSLCVLSIARCSHSRDLEIRGVNESHTGYICPYDTPSNEMVGLTTHISLTSMFSVPKSVSLVYQILNQILQTEKRFDLTDNQKKLFSVNSVPYALITETEFQQIRKRFKQDYRFMDTAIIEESYEVRDGNQTQVFINSYNLLCDSGRIYRPLYNVSKLIELQLVGDEAINRYLTGKTLEQVVGDGVIEMVFPAEIEFYRIANSRTQLINLSPTDSTPVRFCEVDQLALFGMVASCAPMINHSPGNRGVHEPAMAKSAITTVSSNSDSLSEANSKILHSAMMAPVTTRLNEVYAKDIPNGTCAIIGIAIRQENLEDAYTASENWATNTTTERITTLEITLEKEEFQGVPEGSDYRMERFHHMDLRTGLPQIGEYRGVGDAIFAKYRIEVSGKDEDQVQQIVNKSEFIEVGKDGFVQKIKEFKLERSRVFRISLASVRPVETGNKLATRYSQKGVVGGVVPMNRMPRICRGKRTGLIPDLIFSPMSLTSRATPAMILELLLGNYAIATGKQVDASAFSMTRERLIEYNAELERLGYEPWGIETYEDPQTGQTFQMMTGVAYVRILKHTAFEKQKACGYVNVSSIDKIQRQPSKGGATAPVKSGYMDRDVLAAHSCSHLISAMFRDQTDKVLVELCSQCGHLNDRCNRDPNTMKDIRASTHCAKCNLESLITTKVPFTMVNIYFQLLSIGVKLNLWPGVE